MKRYAPAAERNRDPILAELKELLPKGARVLEIASGTGQHASHFAAGLDVTWQPSDADAEAVASVGVYVLEAELPNLAQPKVIDVTADSWDFDGEVDAIFCANMIHITPWACTVGLFAGAGRHLSGEGQLITYGPYRFDGVFTAESNANFDRSLKGRDPSWGVRDTAELERAAGDSGLVLTKTIAMPANNHLLVWRRRASD